MMGIASPGMLMALGAVAVLLLALLLKLLGGKPKRAEKWEKAEIMKKLLALSESEANLRQPAPAVRLRAPAPRPTGRPSAAHLKASSKTTLPSRAKAR
ncbi:MAG: hypothetical protein DMG81_15705 [Acidobacteria bacterium]|nr:MAG: hypothetical protein DMG81_15705 [Acidobacteriota bacterium]